MIELFVRSVQNMFFYKQCIHKKRFHIKLYEAQTKFLGTKNKNRYKNYIQLAKRNTRKC